MDVKLQKINTFKNYITYDSGYRIVYFYNNHHEVKNGLYSKTIEDFIKYFQNENKKVEFINIDDLLNKFLELEEKALSVAIYDVNQKCIARKNRNGIKEINNINNNEVFLEELIYDYNDITVKNGYRIVYFYSNNTYECGTYVKKIEDFMIDFASCDPVMDDDDIPEFISVDDLLNRYLENMSDIISVAIYDVNGTIIAKKEKA